MPSIIAAIRRRGIIKAKNMIRAFLIIFRFSLLRFLSTTKKTIINGARSEIPKRNSIVDAIIRDGEDDRNKTFREILNIPRPNIPRNREMIPKGINFLLVMRFLIKSKPSLRPRPREINTAESSKMP